MMPPLLLLILYITLPALLFIFIQNRRTPKSKALPPGPKGLPIIGNLYKLDNSLLHWQLWNLSKKYGSMFTLRLGLRPAVVISSPKLAEEAMKLHDPKFCGRPKFVSQQKLSYNGIEMAFSPYGDGWKEIRKICVANALSAKRVATFSSIREFAVKKLMEEISRHASSSEVINMKEPLLNLTTNIICKIVLGRSYEEEGPERSRFLRLFDECNAMMGTFFVADYIPFLGWIDRLMGLHARLDKHFKELDEFFQEIIDEHRDPNRKTSEGEEDVTDILLKLKKEENSLSVDLTDDHIKAIIMDILVAATDTTAATTVWAMTALIKHPRVLKKVQEELRSMGGKKDYLDEDEIQQFTYLKAVVKETLRLHLPAPVVPRETFEDCIMDGYEIPAKTLVYVNIWAIHRDSQSWKDPEEFYPERFLDNDINLRGQDFRLFPFGSGRRMCAGVSLATAQLDLILANLLNSFDWELPEGVKKEDIDYERLAGLSHHKKNPLCLVAKRHI